MELHRFFTIGLTLLGEARRYCRFVRLSPEERAMRRDEPNKFVASLLALGPTFVKPGQVLSTRPDFLPAEYARYSRIGRAVTTRDQTIAELAQHFDVHANQIAQWMNQLLEGAASGRRTLQSKACCYVRK